METTYISSTDIVVSYNISKYTTKTTLISQQTTYTGEFTEEVGYLTYNRYNIINNLPFYISQTNTKPINKIIFGTKENQYDIVFKVDFYDIDNITFEPIKTYYVRLYNVLPKETDQPSDFDHYILITNSNGGDDTNDLLAEKTEYEDEEYLTLNNTTYKVYSQAETFSDELRISYSSPSNLDFPYEVLYYSTNDNWTYGQGFVPLASGTTLDTNGVYYLLVHYTSPTVLTNEYYLFKIEILGSSGGFYHIYANGVKKETAGTSYTHNGTQYSEYYIVNINFEDRVITDKFEIVPNDYQNIKIFEMSNPDVNEGIYTVKYIITNYLTSTGKVPTTSAEAESAILAPETVGISPCHKEIFVTFLKPNSDILGISIGGTTSSLFYKTSDTFDKYVVSSTKQIDFIVYEETSPDTDTLTISWIKFYGIPANTISAYAEKDGRTVNLNVKESGAYFYVDISRSGAYILKFEDKAGNVQSFYSGQKFLPLNFIKDVHFTVEYTNPLTTLVEETEMINKAVYNSQVKLKLNRRLIPFYKDSEFGKGDIITVTRNGSPYTGYTFSNEDYSFSFDSTGFYTVYMTAYSKDTGEKIRTEEYSFTIINAKESRYAYEFSGYKDYYIQSIVKDGVDITNALLRSLKTNSNYTTLSIQTEVDGKVVVTNQNFLKSILISYFDEKTGSGRYQITICANDELYVSENHGMSTFTYEFYINSKVVPIKVSIADGGTTNGTVNVEFSAKNVYDMVGECYIIVGNERFFITEETLDNMTLVLGDNEDIGTHYIQVYTMSGNLLFSHRVNLTEPMNTWTIIAIVVGVIAVALVVFIIIKLRKRMGVK